MREALRAHTAALDAVRETQLEQDRRMTDGFATMKVGMDRIVELLQDRP